MKFTTFPVLVVLLLAAPASAWGPVTHQVFGCRALGAYDSSCFKSASRRSFVLGSSAPDAFKLYLDGGRGLHKFDYAGFQLRFAERHLSATTASFDALAYSRAFGTHMAEDDVGHQSDGYLPGDLGAAKDHLHEAAMDTFLAHTFPGTYKSQRFGDFGDGVIDFSTAAIRAYGKEKGNEKLANATRAAVAKAMHRFDSLEAWEQIASAVNLPYRREMVILDPYEPSDFGQALANFERATACSVEAAGAWQKSMSDPATPASAARSAVKEKVAALFSQGQCQPARRPPAD